MSVDVAFRALGSYLLLLFYVCKCGSTLRCRRKVELEQRLRDYAAAQVQQELCRDDMEESDDVALGLDPDLVNPDAREVGYGLSNLLPFRLLGATLSVFGGSYIACGCLSSHHF